MSDEQNTRPGRLRRFATLGLQLVAAFVVAALLTEVALRLVGIRLPPRMPPESHGILLRVDEAVAPGVGHALKAGASGETRYPGVRPGEDRVVRYEINALGFRSAPIPNEKRAGTYRIAMIGDSVTYGTGINADETLAHHLEIALRDRLPARGIEVVNCGVPATNTGQQVAHLSFRVLALDPDMVLICSTIVDTSGFGIKPGAKRERPWESMVVESVGLTSGVFDDDRLSAAQRRMMSLRRRSVLVDLLAHNAYRGLMRRTQLQNYKACWADGSPGVAMLRGALARATRLSRELGFELQVAMYPFLTDLDDDYPFAAESEKLGRICAELAVPFTDLLAPLKRQSASRLQAHCHDRHPNGHANQLVARYWAERLVPEIERPSRTATARNRR